MELKQRFGACVKLGDDATVCSQGNVTNPIHLNDVEGLISLVPESRHTEESLMRIWMDVQEKKNTENPYRRVVNMIAKKNPSVANHKWIRIKSFIHHIYNPFEEYRGWRLVDPRCTNADSHPPIVRARNLVGSILDILLERRRNGEDITDHMDIMSRIVGLNADRQITEMMVMYSELKKEMELKDFVRLEAAREKEYFGMQRCG